MRERSEREKEYIKGFTEGYLIGIKKLIFENKREYVKKVMSARSEPEVKSITDDSKNKLMELEHMSLVADYVIANEIQENNQKSSYVYDPSE